MSDAASENTTLKTCPIRALVFEFNSLQITLNRARSNGVQTVYYTILDEPFGFIQKVILDYFSMLRSEMSVNVMPDNRTLMISFPTPTTDDADKIKVTETNNSAPDDIQVFPTFENLLSKIIAFLNRDETYTCLCDFSADNSWVQKLRNCGVSVTPTKTKNIFTITTETLTSKDVSNLLALGKDMNVKKDYKEHAKNIYKDNKSIHKSLVIAFP